MCLAENVLEYIEPQIQLLDTVFNSEIYSRSIEEKQPLLKHVYYLLRGIYYKDIEVSYVDNIKNVVVEQEYLDVYGDYAAVYITPQFILNWYKKYNRRLSQDENITVLNYFSAMREFDKDELYLKTSKYCLENSLVEDNYEVRRAFLLDSKCIRYSDDYEVYEVFRIFVGKDYVYIWWNERCIEIKYLESRVRDRMSLYVAYNEQDNLLRVIYMDWHLVYYKDKLFFEGDSIKYVNFIDEQKMRRVSVIGGLKEVVLCATDSLL